MKIGIVKMSKYYESDLKMMRAFKKEFKILTIDRTNEFLTGLLILLCESLHFKEHNISEPIKEYDVRISSIYNEKFKRTSDKIESVTEV